MFLKVHIFVVDKMKSTEIIPKNKDSMILNFFYRSNYWSTRF